MPKPTDRPRRGRGRPPKSEGLLTAQALLEAAAAVCAERGFEGTTVARVAERIGVSPAAVYNHYTDREDLLYAAAVHGLGRITRVSIRSMTGPEAAPALASAYLRPEMRSTRRLLAELHLASARDERLAKLMAEWHRSWLRAMVERLPSDNPAPEATVKTIFLLLLGLCHYDDLPAVRAPRSTISELAELAFASLSEYRAP